MTHDDCTFLRMALDVARKSRALGEDPFGAILVYEGKVVHESIDKTIQLSDPTAHAETNLIREYCSENKRFALEGYTLYSSAEPCIMCAGAIRWARISRVVYSVSQERLQGMSGGTKKISCRDVCSVGKKKVEVVGPLLEEEGLEVFRDYEFVPKVQKHRECYGDKC